MENQSYILYVEIIFFVLLCVSIVIMLFTNPQLIIGCMQNACSEAVDLSINLISVYALWSGILNLVEKSGLSNAIATLIKPITHILFDFDDDETENIVALNIASNMLGMGNASTPSGILAMEKFDKKNGKMNKNTVILLLLNTCAIQIFPTTIIGLRAQNNSLNPSDIILPNLLASFITTFIGICIALIIENFKEKRKPE